MKVLKWFMPVMLNPSIDLKTEKALIIPTTIVWEM